MSEETNRLQNQNKLNRPSQAIYKPPVARIKENEDSSSSSSLQSNLDLNNQINLEVKKMATNFNGTNYVYSSTNGKKNLTVQGMPTLIALIYKSA